MTETGKKQSMKKSISMPMWAKLRIAYEYASPEERAQFEKLGKSILKKEKVRISSKLPQFCEPSGCQTTGSQTGGCLAGTACLIGCMQGIKRK